MPVKKQPSHTYRMDLEKKEIQGWTDGIQAIRQAIYKILNTERYQEAIYSWNYGIELEELFGKPIPFVYARVKRRIIEALSMDDRILEVKDFSFSRKKGAVAVLFRVGTTEGDIEMEMGVKV